MVVSVKIILIASALIAAAIGLWMERRGDPQRRSLGVALICVGFCLAVSAVGVALSS